MDDCHAARAAAAVAVLVTVFAGVFGAGSVGPATASGPSSADGADAGTLVGTDALDTLNGTATPTPTASATETATATSTPTPTPDGSLTTDTTETVTNTTGSVTDTTENGTETVTNTTDSVANTTDGTVENTTETVANTTESVSDTTENTTESLVNETDGVLNETDDTLNGALATPTVSVNATASVAANASVGDSATATIESTAAAETATTAPPTLASTATVADGSATDGTAVATTDSGALARSGADSNGRTGSPFPASSGAAAGALVFTGVAVAAASKHVPANAPAAQGRELTWLARATRLKAGAVADAVRHRLGDLPRLLAPLGYSRHDDTDPLDHESRASLFETVERSPGVNLSTLADESDASLSTVRHHLRILEEEHLLVSERIRGQRRYFPSNESDPALVAALDDTATEPILRELAQSGPATVSDLADALGRDPSTISHHVSRLEDDGLVERERDGRSVQNSLAPAAERVLTQPGSTAGARRPVATE